VRFGATGLILTFMNAAFSSGVQAFQAAAAQLNQAAARINGARPTTIPQTAAPSAAEASSPAPSSATGGGTSPAPAASAPSESGGRASSAAAFSDTDAVSAAVDMIKANQAASLAATSIRAADDMVGQLLDAKA